MGASISLPTEGLAGVETGFLVFAVAVLSFIFGSFVTTLVYHWTRLHWPDRAMIEHDALVWAAMGDHYLPKRASYQPREKWSPSSPIAGVSAHRQAVPRPRANAIATSAHRAQPRHSAGTGKRTVKDSDRQY
jgi:hypothetical protein